MCECEPCIPATLGRVRRFLFPSGDVTGFVFNSILKLIIVPKVRTSVHLHHKTVTVIFLKGLAHSLCISQISPLDPSGWQCTFKKPSVQFLQGSKQRHIVTPKQSNNSPATRLMASSFKRALHKIRQTFGRFSWLVRKGGAQKRGSRRSPCEPH